MRILEALTCQVLLFSACSQTPHQAVPEPARPIYPGAAAGEEDPAENGPGDDLSLDSVPGSMGAVRFTHFTHASTAGAGHAIACHACHHTHAPGATPEEGCAGCHRPPRADLDPAHLGPDDNLLLGLELPGRRSLPVPFSHFTHASSAGHKLACQACHHTGAAAGCSACHGELASRTGDGKIVPKLKRAYHLQCQGCHKTRGQTHADSRAPTRCAGCHAPEPPRRLPGPLSYERAQHLACVSCHQRVLQAKPAARAPVTCAGCHPTKAAGLPASAP
jgi:hypothetical protein